MKHLGVGAWASISASCPVHYTVEGSDLVIIKIGDDDQSVELLLDAAGMRKLVGVSGQALTDMDARFEREAAEREARPQALAEPAA